MNTPIRGDRACRDRLVERLNLIVSISHPYPRESKRAITLRGVLSRGNKISFFPAISLFNISLLSAFSTGKDVKQRNPHPRQPLKPQKVAIEKPHVSRLIRGQGDGVPLRGVGQRPTSQIKKINRKDYCAAPGAKRMVAGMALRI